MAYINVPYIIERSGSTEIRWDIYSRLLKDRIVFLDNEIIDVTADLVVAQLLYLTSQDTEKDIHLYINSPGGIVSSGLAIYDTMQFIKPAVTTICIGMAASMAALLLAAGEKGKRFALPHARVMIHQPEGAFSGQAADIAIHAKEVLTIREVLNRLFAKHTGQTEEKIASDTDRNYFMSSQEAKAYNIVDDIMEKRKE